MTNDEALLYRLNAAYQNSGSFRDFNFTERVFVSPVLTWNIGDRTSLTLDGEYLNNHYLFDRGLPSLGDRPAPVPISRLVGLPESVYDDDTLRVGYRLQHQFNQDWQLRNAFSFVDGRSAGTYAIGGGELLDEQFSSIFVGRDDFRRRTYTLQTELEGRLPVVFDRYRARATRQGRSRGSGVTNGSKLTGRWHGFGSGSAGVSLDSSSDGELTAARLAR